MSDEGKGEPHGEQGGGRPTGRGQKSDSASDPTRQLFGHKGGAKPWEPGQRSSGQPSFGQRKAPPEPGAAKPAPAPASAPYPRDAQYAPRPLESGTQSGPENGPHENEGRPAAALSGNDQPTSPIFSDVDDEAELTKLHPNFKLLMRLTAVIVGFAIFAAGIIADAALENAALQGADLPIAMPIPFGVITGVAALIAIFIIIRLPMTRYNARGYQISLDRLRVVRGVLFHSDTIVPFGRVQHIDVDQGPIERALGIATMTLHTAGSHNASVRLPGLGHELAIEMREAIRAHIKRESM